MKRVGSRHETGQALSIWTLMKRIGSFTEKIKNDILLETIVIF